MAQRRQLDMLAKGKIIGMPESERSQTEVSNSERGTICYLKAVTEVSKYGRC